ncbi:TIGR00725 family protein [Bradyrhizobium erythrophlei]|nr:TIGR00725 family protein [Bradyrhizobium erythrophlei]
MIGAIGGDRHQDAAKAFGKAVAEQGCILLTGGRELQESDEVKDAAMIGARSAEITGAVARLVGILPSEKESWVATSRRLFLDTGLKHNIRNVINGLTPDVLVVFGGGGGTLAEAAFAIAASKPIFFGDLPASRDRLIKNFKKYFVGSKQDVDLYLGEPLGARPDSGRDRAFIAG